MSSQPVDVVIDVDPDGAVTVTVAAVEWAPASVSETGPGGGLGRVDVPWILDQILTEHDSPLRVVLHDGGHDFTDIVTRDRLAYLKPRTAPPSRPEASAEPEAPVSDGPSEQPDKVRNGSSGWFEADGYTAGEQIAVAVIVTRLRADARGAVGFTLPAALRAMVGDVIAIGEESREIYVNQADHEPPTLRALGDALNTPARPARTTRGAAADDLNHGFRRHAGGPDLTR